MLSKLYPLIFITVIAALSTVLVVLVDSFTWSKLKVWQDQETLESLQVVFPEIGYYYYNEITEIYTIYDNSRNKIGYAFYTEGRGFTNKMVILIGLEDEEVIKGIDVVSHYESLSLGGEWTLPLDLSPLVEQFNGLRIEDCILKNRYGESDGVIDGITGATISSKAVVNIVRESVMEKIQYIE